MEESSYIKRNTKLRRYRMEEFIRAFESAKMAIIGTTNLALESLDKAAQRAIAEYKSMQQRIAELEEKEKQPK